MAPLSFMEGTPAANSRAELAPQRTGTKGRDAALDATIPIAGVSDYPIGHRDTSGHHKREGGDDRDSELPGHHC